LQFFHGHPGIFVGQAIFNTLGEGLAIDLKTLLEEVLGGL
jgi:hypothetical protein